MEYKHWEKRVDNGSIGEARTKEFIIDRFWVLERSIDRDGADFLIQRKLTDISSIEPPRFGIIQSKFRENIKKIIDIKEEYVNDSFFLFIHTGFEDNKKIYFLTSDDILEFPCKDGAYKLKILDKNYDYEVDSIENVLNVIEDKILETEIEKNQDFAKKHFTGDDSKVRKIEETYELGLLDSYKAIEDAKDIKEKAFKVMEKLLYYISPLKEIITEKNPLELLYLYDDNYDRLNLNTDSDEMNRILKNYEEEFKHFYSYRLEEIQKYANYIEILGENKVVLLIKLKKLIFSKLNEEFIKQNIESEDEVYSTGFDLEFEVENDVNLNIIDIWTTLRLEEDGPIHKNQITGLNFIKDKNNFYFDIEWGVYECEDTYELKQDTYILNLDDVLMKVAEFLKENY